MEEKKLIVIKRDGRTEPFNSNKITDAVIKAVLKVGKTNQVDDVYSITDDVMAQIYYNFEDSINISDIEKIVELVLMTYDREIAREYTSYRSMRDASRLKSSKLMRKMTGMLNGTDESITAENANKDAVRINVQRDLGMGIVCKEMAIDLGLIPKKVLDYMKMNYIHYHDLDYSPVMPMYNCMLIDYKTMFEKSFFLNNAIIDEPKSIQVACTVASQISAGVASSQYGGQTFNRFDEVMAKYVSMSYIKTLINELYSCLMIAYNLNKEESYFDDMIKNLYWKDNKDVKSIDYIKENLYDDIIENIYRLTHYENLYFGRIDEEFKELFKGLLGRIFKITDKRIEKEVYDSMQSLEYQINTISSTNG